MTNYSVGHLAEKYAAKYIQNQGFKILATNWKNRVCEIDIIAQKDSTIHFIEVKYCQNDRQGSGLEYITPKKLKQMAFAAELWVQENNWPNEYCLGAIGLSGRDYLVIGFLPALD